MSNSIKSNNNEEEKRDIKDFDLYKILIDELRKLHTSWIDNFKVILTFNSILLPGILAIFVYISRGKIAKSNVSNLYLIISIISLIGIFVPVLGIFLIRRIKAIMELRQNQMRTLELNLYEKITIAPFWGLTPARHFY